MQNRLAAGQQARGVRDGGWVSPPLRAAGGPDAELLAATVTERLAQSLLSPVIGFAEQLSWALYRLDRKEYGHDLSDDAFLSTRAAVVAAGRTVFDTVLQDPTAFTPCATDLIWAEHLLCTPDRAYKRITGEDWDRDTRYSYEPCSNTEGWAVGMCVRTEKRPQMLTTSGGTVVSGRSISPMTSQATGSAALPCTHSVGASAFQSGPGRLLAGI
ncbi:DUF4240 domain-containing protein [Streptomyces sp. NPDC090741]|uniref:DUF4240 domain-containing protein n=1 Tax=Streptomyces sp. NPDC090741 TaxID=3365967 RepID=UPI00380AF519